MSISKEQMQEKINATDPHVDREELAEQVESLMSFYKPECHEQVRTIAIARRDAVKKYAQDMEIFALALLADMRMSDAEINGADAVTFAFLNEQWEKVVNGILNHRKLVMESFVNQIALNQASGEDEDRTMKEVADDSSGIDMSSILSRTIKSH